MRKQSSRSLSLGEIAQLTGCELRGDQHRIVSSVDTLNQAGPDSITFLANSRYKNQLKKANAGAVVLSRDDVDECPVDCLVSENPYLAHALVMNALYPHSDVEPGIHPTATVASDAQIDASAEVGPGTVIGPRAVIEAGVKIGPNCVLLEDVTLGSETHLVGSVTLGPRTRMGARCLVHPGAVIGGDGFGLANRDGEWLKVPQIGGTVIGDDVEVGSCTSIDRGAIGDTVIANGVKLDSQVHVAHNVVIGKHTAMAGCAAIAGSSKIGEYCTIAGAAGVTGHIELGDHVHISGATTVTRSINKPGLYTSTVPAMHHALWMKNFARLKYLDDMVRRVKSLEKQVAQLRKEEKSKD